ncbi:MAG: hypothetical protein B7Y41_09940 [Hydrogenophilales bacterium 28-61-23]|nr:MAG: hypothetical protein B7Y41_09940 [Hydrogenophilales bacterium 28-61-23]
MALTYCMTSNCPLAQACLRFEDAVASNSLHRTYADFSEELIRKSDGATICPFFKSKKTELE